MKKSIYSIYNQEYRYPTPIWAQLLAAVGLVLFIIAAIIK